MRQTVEFSVKRDVPVEMRDGTILYADIYKPAAEGRYPVILQRTPYNKEAGALALQQTDTFKALRAGYALVIQDVRGRYHSDGDFFPFHQEILDGYDTVEWCAAQDFSNGKVGMVGTSYVGAVQWLAAIAAPPSLKCIIPTFTASDYYEGWTYQGGAFQWGFMCNWVLPYLTTADLVRKHELSPVPDFEARRLAIANAVDSMPETIRTLPLKDFPIDHNLSPYFREWLAHPTRDQFWIDCAPEEKHDKVTVPALNIGGWYDIFLDGTLTNYVGVREKGATAEARDGGKLLIGPWTHTTPTLAQSGEVDFGMLAGQGYSPITYSIDDVHLRFFDLWLKGEDDGYGSEPPVTLYVMGEEVWRHENEWPLARTQFTDYYLHSNGNANSAAGDGALSTDAPGVERPDHFLYDPYHPVPSAGGQLCCYPSKLLPGVVDQTEVESRSDVLVFQTPELAHDVEVTGPVTLRLWATTTATDTDFTGKLVDVFPDGSTRNLTDGIIRARYRNGTEKAEPVTPGEAIEYTIDLWATSNVFKAGHRIALEVSSSNFPRFDRNLNTGADIADSAEMKPALQTILHDAEHPSRVTLPIIPR